MRIAPQELRTYFTTAVCASRRRVFQVDRNAELMLDVMRTNRTKGRMAIHAFVLMPDHLHLVLTPAPDVSLEKAMQFLKGGYSFLLKSRLDVWQRSYTERRLVDADDFYGSKQYVEHNPVRKGLAIEPGGFVYSSAARLDLVDPIPSWFLARTGAKALSSENPS